MIAVNNKIKNAYNQYTTQRKSKIRVGNNEYFIQNMDLYADAYDEGNIVGNTIAKTLKFDIETQYVRGLDEFELLDGIWTGEEYEYVNLGTFKLFEEQGTDDFFSSITAYDKLILFNEVYNPIQTMYPTTIYGLLQNICEQAGVTLGTQSIANGDKILNGNVFVEGETLKDVLKAICQISGNFAVISNDTLKLKLQGEDNIVLNKYQLSKPEYKRTTWKVNQVVLGMQDIIGEYVLKQDDEDVELNGVHKIVINNNPFVYNQDLRQSYIDELFDAVKGFGYVAFETNFEGLPYIELGDSLTIDGYESLVLRYELKSPDGLNSMLQAPSIIDSVIDYVNNTDDIDNKQRRTEYRVDKAEGTITQLTQVTTDIRNDINNNYYTITQTNELVQSASTGITNTFSEAGGNNIFRNTGLWFANNQTDEKEVTSENGKIEVEDAINRDVNETKVYGKIEQDANPSPDYPQEIKTVSGIGNLFNINSTPFIPRVAYNSSGVQQNWNNYSGTTTKTPVQSSTTYTITEDKNTYTTYIVEYDSSETFIQRIVLSNYNKTFTTSVNAKYINISISSEVIPTKVQIEEGTISHTQVPYGHWLPVKVGNKNLFDKNNINIINALVNSSLNIISSTNATTIYIPINPNTTYTIKRYYYSTSDISIFTCQNVPVIGDSATKIIKGTNDNDYTITSEANDKYLGVYIYFGTNGTERQKVIDNLQIEEGPIATDYIQHEEQTTLIDLNKYDENNNIIGNYEICSIGNDKDLLTIKNGVANISKNINKVVLDGSESWSSISNTSYSQDILRFRTTDITDIAYGSLSIYGIGIMSNYFEGVELGVRTKNGIARQLESSGINIFIDKNNLSGTAETNFKTWLSTHNTEVYYALATPETITLNGVYNINLYEGVNHITIEDDDLIPTFNIKYYTRFMVYDFWEGEVERIRENKSSNRNAMSLQNGILYQDELVPNGNYTISFKYKKLISLATAKVIINNTEYELTETEDTEFEQSFAVNSQNIRVEFVCDVNDGCEVYDLMVNAGSVKLAYSQNQNETTTSTVNISKGITITSSDLDVKFKADADGIRTLDSNDTELTKFTDKGMTTKEAIIQSKSQIVGTLWQEVGGQTWITRL